MKDSFSLGMHALRVRTHSHRPTHKRAQTLILSLACCQWRFRYRTNSSSSCVAAAEAAVSCSSSISSYWTQVIPGMSGQNTPCGQRCECRCKVVCGGAETNQATRLHLPGVEHVCAPSTRPSCYPPHSASKLASKRHVLLTQNSERPTRQRGTKDESKKTKAKKRLSYTVENASQLCNSFSTLLARNQRTLSGTVTCSQRQAVVSHPSPFCLLHSPPTPRRQYISGPIQPKSTHHI